MKITIYSTKTCPYCDMLKSWLLDKGMEFTDYSVDTNPIAAQNPNTMANMAQRKGQGMALRTSMLGALIVRRRRRRRNLIAGEV